MADEKMGTQYAREVAELFRGAAAECKFSGVKEKLLGLAGELETLAPKLYFKTQKGTEDMERIAADLGDFKQKLVVCDQAGAESFCTPVFGKLEQIINHVKTMKVRMT
jgi:hypothetical protein